MSKNKDEIIRYVNDLIAEKKNKADRPPFFQDFAEIYIEDVPGGNNKAAAARNISVPVPQEDEKRRLFLEMRWLYGNILFPGSSCDRLQAILFYKQAGFMENFDDDYEGNADFSMYYPTYQSMSYEQLRTYFTWRGRVRRGIVRPTSLSYVFVYLYELINDIGVSGCQDGLSRLIFIWREYRKYEKKLDRYMKLWIKDYYITHSFPFSFGQLLHDHPPLNLLYHDSRSASFFDYYYPYSDYKAKKSIFYSEATESRIAGCFNHVIQTLTSCLDETGVDFADLIFFGSQSAWQPFRKALYYSRPAQMKKSRTVRISDTEIYRLEDGRWSSSRNRIVKENGRLIIGYILRRIEQFYRKATRFKYRLKAGPEKIRQAELALLVPDCGGFYARIDSAILEYYRDSQRKIITVNDANIEKIRSNAQIIQEKLSVDTEDSAEGALPSVAAEPKTSPPELIGIPDGRPKNGLWDDNRPKAGQSEEDRPEAYGTGGQNGAPPPDGTEDAWVRLARSFSPTETDALRMLLRNASMNTFSDFCRSSGIMPEVMVDAINEKAIGEVNDTILELSDEITVLDDYTNDLKRVIFLESE